MFKSQDLGGGGARMFVLCIHVTVQQPQKKPKGSP